MYKEGATPNYFTQCSLVIVCVLSIDIEVNVYGSKAGRFVGKAGCYAVAVIANNATFPLAVNRMAAFHPQSQNRSDY